MTAYPTRPCPHCGQPLAKNRTGAYRCNNEDCGVHRVTYDRVGKVIEIILSSHPESKHLSIMQRLRGEAK